MSAPIANQRSRSVLDQLVEQLSEPHREMLREFDADEDRDLADPLIQQHLVERVGAANFTMHFGDLREMDLVEEVGRTAHKQGEKVIHYRRHTLTEKGKRLVSSHGPEFDPTPTEAEMEEMGVEPTVTETPDPLGREPDHLTDLSDSVDAFIENTRKVILHEGVEHKQGDPKGTVVVTLSYDEETATIKFPAVRWHNTGLDLLFEEVRQAFSLPPDLDQREWGILQQRWIEMAEVVEHDEADDENADTDEESN